MKVKTEKWSAKHCEVANEAVDPNGKSFPVSELEYLLRMALTEIERLQEETTRHEAQIDQIADALEKSAESFEIIAKILRKKVTR